MQVTALAEAVLVANEAFEPVHTTNYTRHPVWPHACWSPSFLGNKDQRSSAEVPIFRIFQLTVFFQNRFEKVQAGLPAPDTTSFSSKYI